MTGVQTCALPICISHVTVGSGIRYDLFMVEKDSKILLQRLVHDHVGGQLKMAPEHTSGNVLDAMRKKPLADLQLFVKEFFAATGRTGKKFYLIPYLMSCHPGSGMEEMREMKNRVKRIFRFVPEQVQAFIPLPMTLSSIQYYTGSDPLTGKKIFVERDMKKRVKQHGIFFDK